jgi:hypothetical protein
LQQPFLCTDEAKYDRSAPSKQNVLCGARSALEVIRAHGDFAQRVVPARNVGKDNFTEKIRNPASFEVDSMEYAPPRFTFVLPGVRRFVLALDLSRGMDADGAWKSARNGLFRFFSHLPLGSEVAIVTFGAKARVNIEPTVVTEQNREGLFGKIPFRLLDDEAACVECGLKLAARLLTLPTDYDAEASGSIVLVTATSTSTSTMLQSVQKTVDARAVPVYNVALTSVCDDVIPLTKYGASYSVRSDGSDGLVQKMADVFIDIINRNSESVAKKIFRKDYFWGGGGNDKTVGGNFVVESGLNRNLWMVLTSPFKEDVELFEVTSPSGTKFVFPKYANGLVYFRLPGDNEAGIWSYRTKLYPIATSGVQISVEVIAESSASKDSVRLESWTNLNFSGANASVDPVVVYASLKQGALPVRDGNVVATITRPGSSTPVEIALRDDGTGYPDITAGDGIYSAYFVDFTSEPGLYGVAVVADHNSGRASVPKPEAPIDGDCCGSTMAANMFSIPTRSFEQHVAGASFKITQGVPYFVRNGEPDRSDVFPPSRVTDLAVASYVNQTLYAVLAWSAPGGDRDMGRAHKFELRCYTNRDALSDGSFAKMGIPVHESLLPPPESYGAHQTATVGLPWANEVFYCGLVSSDASGNRSPVSNLVPVYAAEFTTTTNATYGAGPNGIEYSLDKALKSAVLEAFSQNPTVYIVAGIVSGVIFILVVIISVTIVRSRRMAAAQKSKANARTQIYVNDIDHQHNPALNDPEKGGGNGNGGLNGDGGPPPPYGPVWTTSNHSPASEYSSSRDFGNLYTTGGGVNGNVVGSDQASWAYHAAVAQAAAAAVPVHDYRPAAVAVGGDELDSAKSITPTYQNWSNQNGPKPPSDNGTATTSSTECSTYESEQQAAAAADHARRYSTDDGLGSPASTMHQDYASSFNFDPSSLSLSPSYISERRRRQESLV